MKNIFLSMFIGVTALYSITTNMVYEQLTNIDYILITDDWEKTDHWVCKDNQTWYKYDKVTGVLWKSTNEGEKWKESKDGIWNNAEGKFLKISYGKVVWTNNANEPWKEVPNWTWQGGDGRWYKLDRNWELWVKKQ